MIYPEGTRSTDGTVGEFHSGAVRLARDCGVPIVPVAVLGTRDVLPKHGRLRSRADGGPDRDAPARPTRSTPPSCAPTCSPCSAGARRGVGLAAVARVARLVSGPRGLLVAFCWGFAEALSWPVMAEMTLVFLAAAVPGRVPRLAASIVAGSLAGVLGNAWLAGRGVRLPAPLTTERMQAAARADLAGGATGILAAGAERDPGEAVRPGRRVSWASTRGRCWRGPGWSAGCGWPRPRCWCGWSRGGCTGWLRRCYGVYLLATGLGFATVLATIIVGA